jgi:hypothetical protein
MDCLRNISVDTLYKGDTEDNNNNKKKKKKKRSLKKNLEVLPGKHSIDLLQKTAIIGTSHIIRKVLQCEA